MDDETVAYLLDIANHAARSLIRHLGLMAEITDEDVEDMQQEAVARLLLIIRRKPEFADPEKRGYLFAAARIAAMNYIFWWRRGLRCNAHFSQDRQRNKELRNQVRVISLEALEEAGWQARAEEHEREYTRDPLPVEYNNKLFDIFYRSRNKRGGRGMMAAVRDVRIVNCVWMGYTNAGIAHELGLASRGDASHYRQSIQARLRSYAEKAGCHET
jgi:hypothetical protein